MKEKNIPLKYSNIFNKGIMNIYSKKQNGFTLVELMVAIAISGVVLFAITKVLLLNKEAFRSQTNLEKIQDDSRFAFEVIGQDTRSSGFRGCISGSNTSLAYVNFKNVTTTSNYLSSITSIQGVRGTGSSFTPAADSSLTALSPAPSNSYDILTIRNSGAIPSILTTDMASVTDSMKVNSNNSLASGAYAIIGSCGSSTLFQISSSAATAITSTASAGLGYVYKAGAQIYQYNTVNYYVGTSNGDNILYKQTNGGTPQPIINGVEKFNILYGLDTTGAYNATKYVYADSVTNWTQVVSIRIGLVLKSNDDNITASSASKNTYQFNGVTVTPNDRKLRKVFYTTLSLRNMLP